MSFSMPGNNLYYLPRDDLAPERYEEIISPSFAWADIDIKYVFDDRPLMGFQIINMRERNFNGYTNQLPPHGPREREKLKNMLYNGEVVMLSGFSASPGCLFYITNDGVLICRDPLVFAFDGAQKIIQQYKNSVARRDYSQRGGKPRPTILPVRSAGITQPEPLNTLNSKAAGRLLAAGGIYNGNPEDFRKTAEQLGGDAPAGYNQVMNEQTKGLFIAGVSVAAGLTLGRVRIGVGKKAVETAKIKAAYTLKQNGNDFNKAGAEASATAADKSVSDQKKSATIRLKEKKRGRPAKEYMENLGYNSNKISHIFADKHQMDSLIKEFGSPESALKEMHKAAQLIAKEPEAYQAGSWITIQVGNSNVSVKGIIIKGEFKISTATMRPF